MERVGQYWEGVGGYHHKPEDPTNPIAITATNDLIDAIKEHQVRMREGPGAYDGFNSDIWECYLEVLGEKSYYPAMIEIAVIAHTAEKNVAIFMEEGDQFAFNQIVTDYKKIYSHCP